MLKRDVKLQLTVYTYLCPRSRLLARTWWTPSATTRAYLNRRRNCAAGAPSCRPVHRIQRTSEPARSRGQRRQRDTDRGVNHAGGREDESKLSHQIWPCFTVLRTTARRFKRRKFIVLAIPLPRPLLRWEGYPVPTPYPRPSQAFWIRTCLPRITARFTSGYSTSPA